MATKRQLLENGQVLEVNYSGGYIAYASEMQMYFDGENVIEGGWMISFHQGEMPAFNSEEFNKIDDLLAEMRNISPLNHWRISKDE